MATDSPTPLMYFGWCTGLIKGAAIPPHGVHAERDAHCEGAHAYLPGGRPGKPGNGKKDCLQTPLSLVEREAAVKLDSVEEEAEEVVEGSNGERDRFKFDKRKEDTRVRGESEEKMALPRATA